MQAVLVRTDNIVVGRRHRSVDNDAVSRLAASIEAIGLRQPICVRVVDDYVDEDGVVCDGVPVLVAGLHRLEAVKRLGWEHVECIDMDDDEISAEMWEISENLHRLDLTKEQRDEHIRRYAELIEARRDLQSRQGDAIESKREDGRGHRPEGVAAEVARDTGLSKRTVERALKPKPPVYIKSVLEPESEQDAIIREANAIVSAWNRARQEARELALLQIDAPILG